MLKRKTQIMAASLLAGALAAGCSNANKKSTSPQASAAGPMNQAAVMNVSAAADAAAPPTAPPMAYTPPAPPQPVVYDPPADQPVVEEVVDATDSYVEPATPPSRPRKSTASRASASSGRTKYKVKKGESLWSIAEAKYGNGNKWKLIAAANPKIDPNRVQAGQMITLP